MQLLIFSAASHASPPVAFYYNMINSGNCLIRAPYLMKKPPCKLYYVVLILNYVRFCLQLIAKALQNVGFIHNAMTSSMLRSNSEDCLFRAKDDGGVILPPLLYKFIIHSRP